jgi:hypothetical protein
MDLLPIGTTQLDFYLIKDSTKNWLRRALAAENGSSAGLDDRA